MLNDTDDIGSEYAFQTGLFRENHTRLVCAWLVVYTGSGGSSALLLDCDT